MIFGIRAVMEAIQAGREVDKIMVKKDLQGDLIRELGELLKGRMVPVQRVPVERLNRITRKNHQGVIAFVSAVTYHRLEDLIPFVFEQGRDPFIVLLDGVTDVRNFGAIARTCECAGVDAGVLQRLDRTRAVALEDEVEGVDLALLEHVGEVLQAHALAALGQQGSTIGRDRNFGTARSSWSTPTRSTSTQPRTSCPRWATATSWWACTPISRCTFIRTGPIRCSSGS